MIATESLVPIETVQIKTQVKVKVPRIFELALYSSLLATATLGGWWWWQERFAESGNPLGVGALGSGPSQFAEQIPLFTLILMQKPLVIMGIASEFLLVWALLLAVTPLGWWIGVAGSEADATDDASPVTWLAQKISAVSSHPEGAPAVPGNPGADGSSAQAVPNNAQSAAVGQQQPGQAGGGAAAVPGQPQPQGQPAGTGGALGAPSVQNGNGGGSQAQPAPAGTPAGANAQPPAPGQAATQPHPEGSRQPGIPPASGAAGSTALAQLAVPAEEESLESLTDVSDILAAFSETEVVDPWLQELSESLADVDASSLAVELRDLLHEMGGSQSGTQRVPALGAASGLQAAPGVARRQAALFGLPSPEKSRPAFAR